MIKSLEIKNVTDFNVAASVRRDIKILVTKTRYTVSIITCCFFEGVSMINLKAIIDYNTILFKAQLNNIIAIVSASEAHSKRPVCIKVSERCYIVFALR